MNVIAHWGSLSSCQTTSEYSLGAFAQGEMEFTSQRKENKCECKCGQYDSNLAIRTKPVPKWVLNKCPLRNRGKLERRKEGS